LVPPATTTAIVSPLLHSSGSIQNGATIPAQTVNPPSTKASLWLENVSPHNLTARALGVKTFSNIELPPNVYKLFEQMYKKNELIIPEFSRVDDKIFNLITDRLKDFPKLTNLATNHMCYERVSKIIKSLPFLTALTTLNLNKNAITDEGAHDIGAVLPSLTALTKLHLANIHIGDAGIRDIAAALPSLKALTDLYLGGNRLSDTGNLYLFDALPTLTSLTLLSLNFNNINDTGIHNLVTKLPSLTALTYLNLSANTFGNKGAEDIARILASLPTLSVLNLSFTNMGYEGAHAIILALKQAKLNKRSALTMLDITGNQWISILGLVALKKLRNGLELTDIIRI